MKYNNAQYNEVIYDDIDTFRKVTHSYIQKVAENGKLGDDEWNQNIFDYELERYEAERLFDKAVEKLGKPLWNSEAWRNPECQKYCPFCDICNKQLYELDNDKYCVGQLYIDIPYHIDETSDLYSQIYDAGSLFLYFGKASFINTEKIIGENAIALLQNG